MAEFTTRVELHGATAQDYEVLHTWMEYTGFTRTVMSDDGTEYHLPTAEYNLAGEYSVTQVRDLAVWAASKTGRRNWVLVTESWGRAWKLEPTKLAALYS